MIIKNLHLKRILFIVYNNIKYFGLLSKIYLQHK